MDIQFFQLLAGTFASSIYISSTLAMLLKVKRTKDVTSFSLIWIMLSNIGNLIYWLYVFTLPFGPVYLLHGFHTLSALLLAFWFWSYRKQSPMYPAGLYSSSLKPDSRETLEFPAIRG